MKRFSIVIITRNEESNIGDCIRSVRSFSNDIIVIDAGSDDKTIELAVQEGAETFSIEWQGYGHSRNIGASKAKHDWILALDADERASPELISAILESDLSRPETILRFRRKNFIGNKYIRFGTMGVDKVTRVYNRNFCKWDLSKVHEKLIPNGTNRKMIKGYLSHYAFKSLEDYRAKVVQYAEMSGEKYFLEGRKAGLIKRFFSPLFNSAKSYIFHLGFLEGKNGISIARTIARYTWLKYFHLHKLTQNPPEATQSSPLPRVFKAVSE